MRKFKHHNTELKSEVKGLLILTNFPTVFQKIMVSGQDHDRNNNFFDNCYQIQKIQRKGRGVIATKTLPGTIQNPTQTQLSYPDTILSNIFKP